MIVTWLIWPLHMFLADRTNGRAYATMLRLSVCLLSLFEFAIEYLGNR